MAATLKAIPLTTVKNWATIATQARQDLLPVAIREAVSVAEIGKWSPRRFATVYSSKRASICVDLPPHGAPYHERSGSHQRSVSMQELVDLIEAGHSCYLNQVPVKAFAEFERDLNLAPLLAGRIRSVNLWIGAKTRSGLHYDSADNLFLQIFGSKRAILISPQYSRFLYCFADNPSKSQVDPECPDLTRYPRFKQCELMACDLAPGDALYIPRGWWHFIAADDVSVSVNCWHGNALSKHDRRRLFLAGGTRVFLRAAYDFLWHGMLERPYQRRLFSPLPPGLDAYHRLKERWRVLGE